MEKESKYALIIAFFFMSSLTGAVVLFSYLESYAEVVNPSYRLGGAIAGFFVIFITLFVAYSKLIAKPASKLMKEAAKAITKPKGFVEYKSSERGFSLYYPKNWKCDENIMFPPVVFARGDGPNLNIVTQRIDKKSLIAIEKDPSSLSDFVVKLCDVIYKDWKILERSTIALHGIQCPLYIAEKGVDERGTLRQVAICYLDFKRERVHWITCTASETEYGGLKPLFEKIVSTFQVL